MISMQFSPRLSTLLNLFLMLVFFKHHIFVCEAVCKLSSPSKKEQDLLDIIKPLNGYTFQTQDLIHPANYSYKINICDKVQGQEDGIGAMQYTSNASYILGRYDEVEIMGGTNWMQLTYYGGSVYNSHCNQSERVTKIMIVCDPEILNGTLRILEERNSSAVRCFYLFELGSNVTCTHLLSPTKTSGYSSGSLFCILFFTFVSAYFIIGFLYKRLVAGAKGFEQIPNYSFWKDFGNLQADGCDYICRCGPRQESQAYRGIDDHLKMEDERDDQLLNM